MAYQSRFQGRVMSGDATVSGHAQKSSPILLVALLRAVRRCIRAAFCQGASVEIVQCDGSGSPAYAHKRLPLPTPGAVAPMKDLSHDSSGSDLPASDVRPAPSRIPDLPKV